MSGRKLIAGAMILAFAVAGCERNDDPGVVRDDTMMTTVPGVDTVRQPVEVPTEDTIAVRERVEVDRDTVIDTRD